MVGVVSFRINQSGDIVAIDKNVEIGSPWPSIAVRSWHHMAAELHYPAAITSQHRLLFRRHAYS